MGISFFERMHGELFDRVGRSYFIDFDVKAEASHALQFFKNGATRISGIVRVPPWATGAALNGKLILEPFKQRRITYDFSFHGDDDRQYHFIGRKRIKWHQPLDSFTHLEGRLLCGEEIVATGNLNFDLGDLPDFISSFWPTDGFANGGFSKPLLGDLPFGGEMPENEQEELRALAEALIEPGRHVLAPSDQTAHEALLYLQGFEEVMLQGYRLALRWLTGEAMARYGRPFSKLSLSRRRGILERMSCRKPLGSFGRVSQRAMLMITAPIKMVHFGHPEYLASLGHPKEDPIAQEPRPRYMDNVVTAEDLDGETEVYAETVIVGSGAGGAALAAELVDKGQAVAIVEEGSYFTRKDFTGGPLDRMRRLWRGGGSTFTVGRPPISIPFGCGVGGTTMINSGTCYRTPDKVLMEWQEAGFPSDFLPENMDTYYKKVEAELQVTRNDMKWTGEIGKAIARGAEAMGLSHAPLPRNAPDCDAQGVCILGCPTGAKRSTDVSYIPRALKGGAQLNVGLPVRRILMRKNRAVAVEARGTDSTGAAKTLRIYADQIVLSCGTAFTPILLRENGFRLPQIGRNMSLHPGFGLSALFPNKMEPWKAIPQGYGVQGFEEEGICFEGYYLPPALYPTQIPFFGPKLTYWLDRFDHVGQFGFMVRDRNIGSVRRDHTGQPVLLYNLEPDSVAKLKKGMAILTELMLQGGALEVLSLDGDQNVVRTVEAARKIEHCNATATDFSLLGAHPLATCRMARSAKHGVVDFEHRVYGTDNLYIVDGSVIPSSLGVNPQLTIMAFATRAAEILSSA